MGKAFSLGKLFGIQFRVHFSWFVIFILVTTSLVYPDYSKWLSWVIAVIASLLLFASVVAHELAHSLVGRANGIPVFSITLFIFGGVAQMTKEATRPDAELKMAAAGPLCSLVLGAFFGLFLLIPSMPETIAMVIAWLAINNGILAAFNLIPGFPLDGGRIFRSVLWRATGNYGRASRVAMRLGQGIGYLLILGGISIMFLKPFQLTWLNGVLIAFVGWFLESAASASYRQLLMEEALSRAVTIEVIPPTPPAAPSDINVA
jgi:Zn-dependent protease